MQGEASGKQIPSPSLRCHASHRQCINRVFVVKKVHYEGQKGGGQICERKLRAHINF